MPLTLGRKPGQAIDVLIGGQTVRIAYLGYAHGEAKIRIDAPKEYAIHRVDDLPAPARAAEPAPEHRILNLREFQLVGLPLVGRDDVLASRASLICPTCGLRKGAHLAFCGACRAKLTYEQAKELTVTPCVGGGYPEAWRAAVDSLGFKVVHIPRRPHGAAKAG